MDSALDWIFWGFFLALLGFAGHSMYRRKPDQSFWQFAGAGVVFIIIVITRSGFRASLEQLVCWGVAGLFVYLSFTFIRKEKLGEAFVVFLFAAFIFIAGLSGVQGLLRTNLLANVSRALVSYGEKLNEFQGTLDNATIAITNQQAETAKEFAKISRLQEDLARAQTNLIDQRQKIQEVETLVASFFEQLTFETISASDHNRVTRTAGSRPDEVWDVFVRLEHAPIPKSVEVKTSDFLFPEVERPIANIKNVIVFQVLKNKKNDRFTNLVFSIQYLKDTSQTNTVKNINAAGDTVFFDNEPFQIQWVPRK